jgi:hypothetical protein
MSFDKPDDENVEQFENLLGKPTLLEGEDEERYLRLRAAILRDLKPKCVLDWINAQDQVDKIWEEQRYKRAATALIKGGLLKALEFYFNEICETPFLEASQLAKKYFSTNAKERKEVISLLAQHGITIAELQAKAAQLESGGLQMFDRMVASRESGRRMLRKEAERCSRRQDGDPDETSEQ